MCLRLKFSINGRKKHCYIESYCKTTVLPALLLSPVRVVPTENSAALAAGVAFRRVTLENTMGRGMPGLPRSFLHCAVSPAGACDRGIHQVNPAAERRSLSVLAGGAVQPLAFGGEFHREQQRQHRYALPSKETAPVQPLLSPGRAGSRRFWRGASPLRHLMGFTFIFFSQG